MRVAHRLATLIAVLAAVLLLAPGVSALDNSSHVVRRSVPRLPPHPKIHRGEGRQKHAWLAEMQATMNRERGDKGGTVECCPSVLEMVEPKGGKNLEGIYVTLYKDGDIKQSFYEMSCRKDIENKPCRFIDRKFYNQSRCVQKYSYSYALAWDSGVEHPQRHSRLPAAGWMLDYIQIRSGCACELKANQKRKRKHHGQSERKQHEVDAFESPPDT